ADAYGIPAFRATTPDEVDDAIRSAQAVDGPALIWFEIAEEQNIFPMMPAGKGLSDLIEKWDGAGEGRPTRVRMAGCRAAPEPAPLPAPHPVPSPAPHRPPTRPTSARRRGRSRGGGG